MRYQIEFEGRVPRADVSVLDAAIDDAMDRLLATVDDPAVGAALSDGLIQIAFVVDAGSTEAALTRAHDVVRAATSHDGWAGVAWEMARAEAIEPAGSASI